ncbi:MAG: T9SS type A sorting domain-containing protein [Bacteroidia bacterium]|nr:T9SS type A sorting domain-containing protein [Bacteroidia bacterium]MCZ2276843.1 T9SS type A sorting domain-containing protein [Bacteroidia bacterium]
MKHIHLLFLTVLGLFASFTGPAQSPELWGLCTFGGANAKGTIFKVNGDGSGFVTVFSFDSITGSNPQGSFCLAPNNMLYATANTGGTNNLGTVIKVNPVNQTVTKLLDFNGTNGAFPWGSFMLANDGMLYGGGINNLISLNPSTDVITNLHNFNGSSEGNGITDRFIQSSLNGRLYGLLAYGGSGNSGTIVSYDITNGQLTVEHNFDAVNGKTPYGSLLEASNGKMYGLTRNGGASDDGVLFMFDPATGSYAKLIEFNTANGKWPWNSMIQVSPSLLYGLISNGGPLGGGVIFSFDITTNSYNIEYNFDFINGSLPWQSFIQASDTKLYATTGMGGASGYGTVFKFDHSTNIHTLIHSFVQSEGTNPSCDLTEVGSVSSVQPVMNLTCSVSIWPNPTSGHITLNPDNSTETLNLEVFNLAGQSLKKIRLAAGEREVDLSLPPCPYLLSLTSSSKTTFIHLIIQ